MWGVGHVGGSFISGCFLLWDATGRVDMNEVAQWLFILVLLALYVGLEQILRKRIDALSKKTSLIQMLNKMEVNEDDG